MDVNDIPMIAGHPALDFVNTVEGRGSSTVVNYLADYGRFVRWCACAGVVPDTKAESLLDQASLHPILAARGWERAMVLRENLNTIVRALVQDEAPDDRAMIMLNGLLNEAHQNRSLLADKTGLVDWVWQDQRHGLDVPAWEMALRAADLITDGERRRVKICANGPCDWLFLDTSRNGRRRWCRMNVCGNESKVRRFRERQRRA